MELVLSAILLFGLPIFMLLFFKSNVGIMFLSACTGLVLLSSLDPVAITAAGAVIPSEGEAYVRLTTVIMTMVFAGFIFRRVLQIGHKLLHMIIILFLGLTLWLTLPAATGVSWLVDSTNENYWQNVNDFRTLIIAIGFGLSLVGVMFSSKQRKSHKSSHS